MEYLAKLVATTKFLKPPIKTKNQNRKDKEVEFTVEKVATLTAQGCYEGTDLALPHFSCQPFSPEVLF